MKRRHTHLGLLALTCTAMAGPALAGDWTERVTLGGFASANYNLTNSAIPFNGEEGAGHDDKGSWSGTLMGINVNARINDRFRFASQIFASKAEGFSATVDWAFGELRLADGLDLRAGKLKFPLGIVNEYADIGYSMPWLKPPAVIYSELGAEAGGPQLTRESYTGASLLGSLEPGDWILSADLFTGETKLEGASSVRQQGGLRLSADWDDTVFLQAAMSRGVMHGTGTLMGGAMEGTDHQSVVFGLKADWNDILVYAERGDMKMGKDTTMSTSSWYATVGYQMGSWLPHVTYQDFAREENGARTDKQSIATLGLRWDVLPDVAVKAELSRITTDQGSGLFVPEGGDTPDKDVNMIGLGLDTIF